MNTTANYKLPQWDPDDPIRREDFNDFAAKAESALSGLSGSIANLRSTSNARISMKIQKGVSTTEVRYDFPFSPDFVMVLGTNNIKFFFARGATVMYAAEVNGARQGYNVNCGFDYITVKGTSTGVVVPYLADPNVSYFVFGMRQNS